MKLQGRVIVDGKEQAPEVCIYCCQRPGEVDTDFAECGDEHPGGLACCRAPGHEGEHIACGIVFHDIRRWPQGAGREERDGEG